MKKILITFGMIALAGTIQAATSSETGLTYDPVADYYQQAYGIQAESGSKHADTDTSKQYATGWQWPEGL